MVTRQLHRVIITGTRFIKTSSRQLLVHYITHLFVLQCCLPPSLVVKAFGKNTDLAHTFSDAYTDVLGHYLPKKPNTRRDVIHSHHERTATNYQQWPMDSVTDLLELCQPFVFQEVLYHFFKYETSQVLCLCQNHLLSLSTSLSLSLSLSLSISLSLLTLVNLDR